MTRQNWFSDPRAPRYLRIDMHADTCPDLLIDLRVDLRLDLRAGVCTGMGTDVCRGMRCTQ